MYKSKLYQLCQKRAWSHPDYNVSRYGPDHNSRFRASVIVNGVQFNADDLSSSSKEAQNKVSQVALEHFGSALQESLPMSIEAVRSNLPYKNQLQEYAFKNFYCLPKYAYACEGPRHALQVKAEVTVGGKTFQGTRFFSTRKEAERDAAKTALMLLSTDETNNAKDDSVSYKSPLNDFARIQNTSMPSYKTTDNGMDGFSSIADVGNSSFFGDVAKSEKHAENNAAIVAWLKPNEGHGVDSGNCIHLPSSPKHVSMISHPSATQELEESPTAKVNGGTCLDDREKNDSKKDHFQKNWSLEDEIMLLNSILEFRLEKGKEVDPSTLELFCDFLEGKLSFTNKPMCSQVSEKMKALEKKYSENTVDCFTAEHDLKMKMTARQVWPVEVENNHRKRKCSLVEEEVRKLNIFDPSKELEFGEEAEALEEKMRKQKILDTKQELKRKNLKRETMELILRGIGKSDCSVLNDATGSEKNRPEKCGLRQNSRGAIGFEGRGEQPPQDYFEHNP